MTDSLKSSKITTMITVTTSAPRATASHAVRAKAVALHAEGRVRRVARDQFSLTYKVRGDYGLTYTVLQHRENIDADRCTCAWNKFQPYSTAICSHVLAARFENVSPITWWRKVLLRVAERVGR